MPVVWRYVTKTYLKIFSLCLLTLFGMGFLIKYKKLMLLIVAGATSKQAFLITLCMLSTTLPHILGLCTFISTFLTTYKLNSSGETAALRSSGLSFSMIFAPLYFAGGFLLLTSFFLVSEGIPYTKLLLNKLCIESQTINPLVLLRKNSLPFVKNIYTEMHLNDNGSASDNVLVAYFLEDEKRIALLLAEKLDYTDKTLNGENVAWIINSPSKGETFDHLIIDNQAQITSPESLFTSLLNKSLRSSDLTIFSLYSLAKIQTLKAKVEFFQRISKILYPFTFTILGLSSALINRKRLREWSLLFLFLAGFFYFISFFTLKKSNLPLSLLIFFTFIPHILILFLSFRRQKHILKGNL